MTSPYFTDEQVDDMTEGLEQNAAKIRYLRSIGLRVDRKPNGRPLVWVPAPGGPSEKAQNDRPHDQGVVVGLKAWASGRKTRGQKAQGR